MNQLEKILQDLELYGFCFLENLVPPETLKRLSPLYEREFNPARVGKTNGPKVAEEIRGDQTLWLDPDSPPEELAGLFVFLSEVKASLNSTFFLGLKDFECHLSKYPAGTFYKKHLDRFETDSSRSVSFIFYLHDEWTNKDGGELLLYNKSNEVLEMILPKPGSFMIFLSERFPHEVKTCQKERRSLTGWMHTKILT